jgi:hypothetical protein
VLTPVSLVHMRRFNQVARRIIAKGSKARSESSTKGPACHDEKQTSEPSYLSIWHDATLVTELKLNRTTSAAGALLSRR